MAWRALLVAALFALHVCDVHTAVVGSVGGPSTSAKSTKRIGAVVDTLRDLAASIENEEKVEAANFKCLMQWCDDTVSTLQETNDRLQFSLEDDSVAVKQHTAAIANLGHTLGQQKQELEEATDSLDQATGIRDEEHNEFKGEKELNMQSQDQIKGAIGILEKVHQTGGFLQNGAMQHVQLNEPGESSFILGIFRQLKNKLQQNGESAQKAELQKQDLHNTFRDTKNQQLSSLRMSSKDKKIQLTETQTDLAQSESDIVRQKKGLAEGGASLEHSMQHCDKKREEWNIRGEDRAREKAAIREAISYLMLTLQQQEVAPAPAGAALLQVRSAARVALSYGSFSAAQALIGAADGELATLSAHTDSKTRVDVFGKLKFMISQLIGVLQKEQKAEAEKKSYCGAEREKKLGEQTDHNDTVSSLNATIDEKTNLVQTLTSETDQINASIGESGNNFANAAKLRKQQKAIYEAGTKDRTLSLRVLQEARAVLAKFYETNEAFVQLSTRHHRVHGASLRFVHFAKKTETSAHGEQPTPPQTWTSGTSTRHTGEGNIVLNMLDNIIHDVDVEQQDAEIEENEAAAAFVSLQQDTRGDFDEGMREITLRVARRARTLVQLDTHRETREDKMTTLQAIGDQLLNLGKECNELLSNFAARTKARDFEIAQLRDVIDIISGSSIAARTGLLEEDDSAPGASAASPAEMSEMQILSSRIHGMKVKASSLLLP